MGLVSIGLIFFCIAILAAFCIAILVAFCPEIKLNSNLGPLTLSAGVIIFLITLAVKEKKFRPVLAALIAASALQIWLVLFAETEAAKWNYTSFAMAILAIGLGLQAMFSDLDIEKLLKKIDEKIPETVKNTTQRAKAKGKPKQKKLSK